MSILSFWGVDSPNDRPYNPPIADADGAAALQRGEILKGQGCCRANRIELLVPKN
jgi:hypothetical protein